MPKVLVAIAEGTEELEAVTVINILRRADIDVSVASIADDRKVTASRGVQLTADCHIEYCQDTPWDMVVIPGGEIGAKHMAANVALLDILRDQIKAERWVAAICAAPALVLAANELIKGATATCYPAFREILATHQVHHMNEAVVEHRKLITSQGPGTAMAFALSLVSALEGEVRANSIASDLLFEHWSS